MPLKRGCVIAGSIADHIEQHGVVPCGHYAAPDTAMLRKHMRNKRGHSGFRTRAAGRIRNLGRGGIGGIGRALFRLCLVSSLQ